MIEQWNSPSAQQRFAFRKQYVGAAVNCLFPKHLAPLCQARDIEGRWLAITTDLIKLDTFLQRFFISWSLLVDNFSTRGDSSFRGIRDCSGNHRNAIRDRADRVAQCATCTFFSYERKMGAGIEFNRLVTGIIASHVAFTTVNARFRVDEGHHLFLALSELNNFGRTFWFSSFQAPMRGSAVPRTSFILGTLSAGTDTVPDEYLIWGLS